MGTLVREGVKQAFSWEKGHARFHRLNGLAVFGISNGNRSTGCDKLRRNSVICRNEAEDVCEGAQSGGVSEAGF
jgi:hypothetical protein